MKTRTTICFVLIAILCYNCTHRELKQYTVTPFIQDSTLSNKAGVPFDSMAFYFPRYLFNDTIRFVKHNGKIDGFDNPYARDRFIRDILKDTSLLISKDSLDIKENLFFGSLFSFSLYKMKEPILSNYYLNRNIYRFIIERSFDPFLIITLEKMDSTITITTKQLNRHVTYPFMVEVPCVHFMGEPHTKNIEDCKKKDTLNNTNYYVTKLIERRVSSSEWDIFLTRLDSINFWQRPSRFIPRWDMGLDGSLWVIESQNELGYKFYCTNHAFDDNVGSPIMDRLFRFVIMLSGIDQKSFKFY